MDALLPCPFCGSTEICAIIDYELKEFRIFCGGIDDCIAEMRLSFADANIGNGTYVDFSEMNSIMKQLIDKWNSRIENSHTDMCKTTPVLNNHVCDDNSHEWICCGMDTEKSLFTCKKCGLYKHEFNKINPDIIITTTN